MKVLYFRERNSRVELLVLLRHAHVLLGLARFVVDSVAERLLELCELGLVHVIGFAGALQLGDELCSVDFAFSVDAGGEELEEELYEGVVRLVVLLVGFEGFFVVFEEMCYCFAEEN